MPAIETSIIGLIAAGLLGYLLGSIPFGLVLSKLFGLGDIRKIGSGNIGATNVLRTGSKGVAAATLLLDAGKGAIALLLGRLILGEDAGQLAGLCAFLGHLYPVWLGFKGGKGVATAIGLYWALAPLVGIIASITWLASAGLSKRSSIGGLASALAAPIACIFFFPNGIAVTAVVALLIWIKHRANIQRVINGTEPKISI